MGSTSADILAEHGIRVDEDDKTLEHYGVPGMKWGKRRARNKARRAANAQRAEARSKVKDMSDDDLKAAINRLKLEKEFNQLNAHEISTGQKVVTKILSEVGTQAAKSYLNGEINKVMTPGGTKVATKLAVAAAPKAKPKVYQFEKRPGFE